MNIRKACSLAAAGIRFSRVASLRIPQRDSLNYAGSSPRWWWSSSRCAATRLFASTTDDDTPEAANKTDQNVEALKHYHLKGMGKRSHVVLRTDTGHTLATDVPRSMGGEDRAAQPIETLLAALAGCTQATAVYVGRHMMQPERILVDRLDFDLTAYRDERGALQLPIEQNPDVSAQLQAVSGTIKVHTKQKQRPLSLEQLELLQEQTERRCPVASLLVAAGCRMDIRWEAAAASDDDDD